MNKLKRRLAMRRLLFVLMAIFLSHSFAYGYQLSDYSWFSYNGNQYAITLDYSNWEQAEIWATEVGGHLVTINDSAENSWLSTQFQGYYDEQDLGNQWASFVWIGFKEVNGQWVWASGEAGSLDSSPPWWHSLSDGEFAYLHTDTHPTPRTWWNAPGLGVHPLKSARGIIEIHSSGPFPAVPEPTTMLLLATGLIALAGFRKKFRKGQTFHI